MLVLYRPGECIKNRTAKYLYQCVDYVTHHFLKMIYEITSV